MKGGKCVRRVWIVARLTSLATDEIHHLVFSFAGNRTIGENDRQVLPSRIVRHAVMDVPTQIVTHFHHKLGSRSDGVRVPGFRLARRDFLSFRQQLRTQLVFGITTILRLLPFTPSCETT